MLSEQITLNSFELSTYKKIHYELKNVENILGVLLITILKFRNNCFYKNIYSKNCRINFFPNHYSGILGGKINIDNTSEDIKCGNLKEKLGNLPLWGKKGNNLTDFMVILSNKIMQKYQRNHPPKGVMVITPDDVVTENG